MSQELNNFFVIISTDKTLQERLFATKELIDVAHIAQEMGFNVTGADVLRAQAGRVLLLPSEELEAIAAGERAKTGARWGRAGKGYLDNAGFWVNKFIEWGSRVPTFEPQLEAFIIKVEQDHELQKELLAAKTFNDIAALAHRWGYEFSGIALLRYQAVQVLNLDNEKGENVSHGAD
jgi:predicted ribosomally synthesized peptide with nif11-like leader